MPRFEFDPTKVSASIEIFEKNEYEFQVGEPKSFMRKNRKNEDSYGVRFPLTIMEGVHKGKRTVFSTYQQSEGAQAMTKQFLMAVLGYEKNRAGEDRFNEDVRGKDWSFDPETGAVGDIWREATGQRVYGSLDIAKNDETGDPMQQFKGWRPIGS